MTIMRKYNYQTQKEIQGTEFINLFSINLSMAIYTCTFLIQKSYNNGEKDT